MMGHVIWEAFIKGADTITNIREMMEERSRMNLVDDLQAAVLTGALIPGDSSVIQAFSHGQR